jgi:hypothetical protein
MAAHARLIRPWFPERGADALDARSSGTRRAAPLALAPERIARDSQRPTVPVPDSENLAGSALARGSERAERPTVPVPAVSRRREAESVRAEAMARHPAPAAPTVDEVPFLDEVPYVTCPTATLLEARLDHRAGFVLSLVDGRSTVESVFDACPLPEEDTCFILGDLQRRGLVAMHRPPPRRA